MSEPSVQIVLALEAAPRVRVDFMDSGDEDRVIDWLEAHPRYLELVRRALELEAEQAA